jgi:hypothetical protein
MYAYIFDIFSNCNMHGRRQMPSKDEEDIKKLKELGEE